MTAGRIRPGVRAVSEGAVQAVPRQGAAGRLRPRPVAEPGEDPVRRGAVDCAVALGRSDRGRHRQPEGSRARHRADLGEGRLDRPQPHRAASTRTWASTTSSTMGERFEMPWMAWSPKGDRLAYFVRTEKERTLDHPERAHDEDRGAHPDEVGGRARVAGVLARRPDDRVRGAARRHRRHLHVGSRAPKRSSTSPTTTFADCGADVLARRQVPHLHRARQRQPEAVPARSRRPRRRRRSPSARTTKRRRSSSTTTRSCSRRPPPIRPCRSIPRWRRTATSTTSGRSTCTTGELRQYTDALGGNWSPVVLNEGKTSRIAFISYYKGDYGIHTLERKEPLHTASSVGFRRAGPDHRLPGAAAAHAGDGQRAQEGPFEKMFLEGRPPVNVGVTSNGDIFGGSQISFGDVLGDKQINCLRRVDLAVPHAVAVVRQPRRAASSGALQGYSQTTVLLRAARRRLLRSARTRRSSAATLAMATRTVRGGSAFGIYPFNRYRRVEFSGGLVQLSEDYNDPGLQDLRAGLSAGRSTGRPVFRNGTMMPLGVGVRPGNDGLPRIRAARRQHDAAGVRRRRRRSATRCRARPSTSTRGTTCASAASACWRRASAGSRASASIPTSSISAATPSCAATTTCSSPVRTWCSPTPSCASR